MGLGSEDIGVVAMVIRSRGATSGIVCWWLGCF